MQSNPTLSIDEPEMSSIKNPNFLSKLREIQPISEQRLREQDELRKKIRIQELIENLDKQLVQEANNGQTYILFSELELRDEGVLDALEHYRELGFRVKFCITGFGILSFAQ
jgi:hypothetical protein